MIYRFLNVPALLFALTVVAQAAPPPEFETVLVPISGLTGSPGAFGSLWKTEFTAVARIGEVLLAQTSACLACTPLIHISAGFPLQDQFGGLPGDPPGALLYVSRASAENAWFNLRIRDISRESQDWGTEIPVVRERNFFADELLLVDIPIDNRFRQALRIYDADDRTDTVFHVQISPLRGATVIAERDFVARSAAAPVSNFPRVPAVVELTDLRVAFPEIAATDRAMITVRAVTKGTRFWAFVSVTNNETQHVTLITPQH